MYLGCFRGVTRREEEIIAMQRPLVILAVSLLAALMVGCSSLEISNPFSNDPLTGGVDTGKSQLLGVPTPAGMQRFPTHGYQTSGAGGAQGLEIFRGDADMGFVAQIMFTGLQGQGWHLRMAQRKGVRAVYVYERGSTIATLTVDREAVGTVLAIWVADRMPDGATLPMQENTGSSGYGGSNGSSGSSGGYSESTGGGGGMNTTPKPGFTETWGGNKGGGLQERNL